MRASLTIMAMLLSLSAPIVSSAPLNSRSPDDIGTKRDALIEHRALLTSTTNLSMSPWPTKYYALPLGDNYKLVITLARPYVKRPLPHVSTIQNFFRDFAINLEHAYPPPALAPKEAGQSYYDTDSFTRWDIRESVIPLVSTTAPSKYIIAALLEIEHQVSRHGPPAFVEALLVGPRGSKSEVGFNSIAFSMTPLERNLAGNVVDATSGFASTS